MADKYVYIGMDVPDPENGSGWANAYVTVIGLQTALDAMVAGETLRMASLNNADVMLSAILDIDVASGGANAGTPISWIGYNDNSGSPIVDGTRVVLDAGATYAQCLKITDKDYWNFQNLEFQNATDPNIAPGDANDITGHTWINCSSHHAGADGWGKRPAAGDSFIGSSWFGCESYNNSQYGFVVGSYCAFIGCVAQTNATYDYVLGIGNVMINCIANGTPSVANVIATGSSCVVVGCVLDGAPKGFTVTNEPSILFGNRISNHSNSGIYVSSATILDMFNTFSNCDRSDSGANVVFHEYKGVTTRIETTTDGYEDLANKKFKLLRGAPGYRRTLAIDDNNTIAFNNGLPNVQPRFWTIS